MGYTHFYNGLSWDNELAVAADRLISMSDVSIRGGDGEGDPVVDETRIWINGDGFLDEEYETFSLSADENDADAKLFKFTKTNHKPYDEVVTAILTYAALHRKKGWETIGSDGSIVNWHRGIALYEETFGNINAHDLRTLEKILGTPAQWSDGLPRTREQYYATVSFCEEAAPFLRNSYGLVQEITNEEVPLDLDDERECCLFLETITGCSGFSSWRDEPSDENCMFLADVSMLAATRWSELKAAGQTSADFHDWEDNARALARNSGIPDDVFTLWAGVPLNDVLA